MKYVFVTFKYPTTDGQIKKWQEEQERVMLQHHKRLHATNLSNDDLTLISENRATLPNLSASFDSEHFTVSKPKQPFLRRGSGLSRFKMAPGEQFTAMNKAKSARKSIKSPEIKIISHAPEQRIKSKAVWNNASVSSDANASLLIFEELEKQLKDNSPNCNDVVKNDSPPSSTPRKIQSVKNHMRSVYNFSPKPNQVIIEQPHKSYTSDEFYEDIKEKNEKIMQENKKQLEDIEQYEKRLHDELLLSLEQAIKFKEFLKQDKAVGSSSPISTVSCDIDNPSEVIRDFDDTEKWESNISLDSTSSTISSNELLSVICKCDAATMTDCITQPDSNLEEIELLRKSLQQEVKVSQEQTNEIKQLKKQLEQQVRELEKQRKNILKQAADDKDYIERSSAILEDERKKLTKEKMVFERYVKDLQNKPNRKEREEISVLKEELAAIKETYKLKEVKNSTLQARLRNQIKSLERENLDLKLETEKLMKENGRLIATQRLSKKPSDTKLLHEINKNITKLAQDQLNKINEKHTFDTKVYHEEKENNQNSSNSSDTDKYYQSKTKNQVKENKNIINISDADRYNEQIHEDISCYTNYEYEQTSKRSDRNTMSNRTEKIMSDGSRIVTYSNGNVKTVSADGNIVEFKYFNGDIKTTNLIEGNICYYYAESNVRHTTKADGIEILEYPDGQIETRLTSGTSEIKYPNGITVVVNEQGDKMLLLPNGQKEIHTKDHKRREYPDGTVKLLYPDGQQETRYSNGRVRIKDKEGALLFDSLT